MCYKRFLEFLFPLCVSSAINAGTFTDVTVAAGVSYDHQNISAPNGVRQNWMSGGAAVADYDLDGWPDLFVTRLDDTDILFRNNQDGTFTDVTAAAFGVPQVLPTNGACWGDLDNDGDPDLYVLAIRSNRYYLYINDGSGGFTEQAIERGVALVGEDEHFGQSPTVGDFNNDGFLDLHVTEWRMDEQNPGGARQNTRLFLNRGSAAPGHFVDVTEVAGVAMDTVLSNNPDRFDDQSFSNRFADMDKDGWVDLVLTGDHLTSRLFWNNGDGTFTDGTEAGNVGTDSFGMGSSIADYDGDGDLDWFVTSIYDEVIETTDLRDGNRLFRNDGGRSFTDVTDAAGVRDGAWGWAATFCDIDNDGDLDLAQTNGLDWPEPLYRAHAHEIFIDDPSRLWVNDGTGVFNEEATTRGVNDNLSGKGLLSFDYDRDGDLDIFITNCATQPILYRNDNDNGNHWLKIATTGTSSNRDGFGAFITVTPNLSEPEKFLVHEMHGGNNFLSQNEKNAHFGLGSVLTVDQVKIKWPSGVEQTLTNVAADQLLAVTEPAIAPVDDSEPDGLPDSWEQLQFGDLNALPSEDADLDGFDNYKEYIAGTDPNNRDDRLIISNIQQSLVGGDVTLMWPAKAGRRYRLEKAILTNPSQWEAVALKNVSVDGSESFEEPISQSGAFYRLAVEME